jgi:uncharacterized protein (DUF1501 family)
MLTRRDFLQACPLIALAPTVPALLAAPLRAATPERDSRVLVVVELNGGNDGINTVVPFADDGYAKHRRALRLPKEQLLRLDDRVALHPALRGAAKLFEEGRLAIVQGVGYPNPERSHFESMAIWHSGRREEPAKAPHGWLGRALDAARRAADGSPDALLIGLGGLSPALRGKKTIASTLATLEDLVPHGNLDPRRALPPPRDSDDLASFLQRSFLEAYTTAGRLADAARVRDNVTAYPASDLAERLRLVARLLKAGFGTRVFYLVHPGYDTHNSQLVAHQHLLGELSGALFAFLDDLKQTKLDDRALVLVFSEFGRRVEENASHGTDHGTAGPVLLAGAGVKHGLHGTTPSLLDLADGDLKVGIDFRRIYATVLEDWLGLPAAKVLGDTFESLSLLRQ